MDKKELAMALKDMSDEEILALIRDARKEHTGYEKTNEYFYSSANGDIHKSIIEDATSGLYDCANYYSDINVARECSRADTLMRKLRRFAAEHGGCAVAGESDTWYITYYYPDSSFEVKCAEYDCGNFSPGMIFFRSEKAAQDAIDEFVDELYWYFNFYEPMSIPHDWVKAND